MLDINDVEHRAFPRFANAPLFEDEADRTLIVLRPDPCGRPGLGQLLPSEYVQIPYKGYTLNSVNQYVLVRMAESVSVELSTQVMSTECAEHGFIRISHYLGDKYDPKKFSENSADIYCYMVEGMTIAFSIHEHLRKLLVSTGDASLVTYDHSWLNSQWGAEPIGIGPEDQVVWAGENIVGRALESVRESLVNLWGDDYINLESEVGN